MCQIDGRECTTKSDIEDVLMDINYDKIQSSKGTPFLQEPLLSEFGDMANTPAADAVLQGSYVAPDGTDPHARLLLSALATPTAISSNTGNFRPRRHITPETHIKGWRRAKERTSSGMSGLHFGVFKANAEIPHLAALDASI
jgi:hypothetical protein